MNPQGRRTVQSNAEVSLKPACRGSSGDDRDTSVRTNSDHRAGRRLRRGERACGVTPPGPGRCLRLRGADADAARLPRAGQTVESAKRSSAKAWYSRCSTPASWQQECGGCRRAPSGSRLQMTAQQDPSARPELSTSWSPSVHSHIRTYKGPVPANFRTAEVDRARDRKMARRYAPAPPIRNGSV